MANGRDEDDASEGQISLFVSLLGGVVSMALSRADIAMLVANFQCSVKSVEAKDVEEFDKLL